MIKFEELRYGNLLDRNGLMEVVGIKTHAIKIYDHYNKTANPTWFHPESFKGIPLTPEWLERMGFDNKSTEGCWIFYKPLEFGQRLCLAGLKKNEGYSLNEIHRPNSDGEFEGYDIAVAPEIKHVHTLQNLFFALTKKELEIKPIEK
jgi:hypothetical protein